MDLRNNTTAQALRVANTWTDGNNYEIGVFDWKTTANTLTIGTQNAGTGNGTRSVRIQSGDPSTGSHPTLLLDAVNQYFTFGKSGSGTVLLNIDQFGNLYMNEASASIGTISGNRPNAIYSAGPIKATGAGSVIEAWNTAYDATNFERGTFKWVTNELHIGAESGGTGQYRPVVMGSNPDGPPAALTTVQGYGLRLYGYSAKYWTVTTSGNFTPGSDNLVDIGASGATRPRTGYFGTSINSAGTLVVAGDVQLGKTITLGGITGAQTINKTSGSVNFAAAATSLVVTDSLVTTSSVIICTIATNDATAANVKAVAASGSFTIYLGTAPTAETRVNFFITN